MTMCTIEGQWRHWVDESKNPIKELNSLGVQVLYRKSLSIRRYDHISLAKVLNKINEKNDRMTYKKNRVIMLQVAHNKAITNVEELSVEDKNEILSLSQCKSDFE